MTTPGALVAADRDLQHSGTPSQRFVGQPPLHRSPRGPFTAAASTPTVELHDPTGEDGPIGLQTLPRDLEAKLVEPAEGRQVRTGEAGSSGNIGHVEVFQMGSVRTSIIGRPRPLSGQRRAGPTTPCFVMSHFSADPDADLDQENGDEGKDLSGKGNIGHEQSNNIRLGYTIHLNLPATTEIAVFSGRWDTR